MNAISPCSAALLAASLLPSLALGSSETYVGPRWTIDTGETTPCSRIVIGEITNDFDLDAVMLFGDRAVLAEEPGVFEALTDIRTGVSDLAMVHASSGDVLVMATSVGLESCAVSANEQVLAFSFATLDTLPSEHLKVVTLDGGGEGLASFTGNRLRILSVSGAGLQVELDLQFPAWATVADVELADTHPSFTGREVHVVIGEVLYVLPWGSGSVIETRATGGVTPWVGSTARSAAGPELVLYHAWDATLGRSVLRMFNELETTAAPIDLAGAPFHAALTGTDWSSSASEGLFLVTSDVLVMEQVSPATFELTGAEFEDWNGGSGNRIDIPGSGPLAGAMGDVDGDGDDDLLLVSGDGSELHMVPGARIWAEDQRIRLQGMELSLENGGYGLRLQLAGHLQASPEGPLFPPGLTEMELTIWYQPDSASWMNPLAVYHEFVSFEPGSSGEFIDSFSSPGGTDQVFHIRLRPVLRNGDDIEQAGVSRIQMATFAGDGSAPAQPPLPASWTNTIYPPSGDPDTTGTWRETGGGPPPPVTTPEP